MGFTDLVSEKARIGKEKIICYIIGHMDGIRTSDVLFPYNSFWSIMARQRIIGVQTFWVTVYAPADAEAGTYKGRVWVTTKNAGSGHIDLRLRIWNFKLPERMHLKTHFMMKYQELRSLYSELPDKLFEETIFRYRVNSAEHRISIQGNIPFPFRIIKGNMLTTYRRFDEEMNMLINLGMNVFCIHLRDMDIDPRTYSIVLSRLQDHLRRRQWLDVAHLHLGRISHGLTLRTQAELAKIASPGVKVVTEMSSLRRPRKFVKLIDIWIADYDRSRIKNLTSLLRGRGEVWLDCTCKPGKRGPFCKYHKQVDFRKTFWWMWCMGVKGLVYDSALPTTRSKEPLIYVWEEGILNSVRWETIRDGIEDYEYLSLLDEIVSSQKVMRKSDSMAQIQRRASRLLKGIRAKGGSVNVGRVREQIAAILEACSAGAPSES